MDTNVKVLDAEKNAARYASNTDKQSVLISSKDHEKYSQVIENIWFRNLLHKNFEVR